MTECPHSQHRHRLAALSSDARLLDAVVSGFPEERHEGWRRSYGRFFPGASPYASVVFDTPAPCQRLITVHFHEWRPTDPASGDRMAFDDLLGWLRVVHFPADQALPTLPAVLSGHAVEVVRYRPGRRCTCRTSGPGGRRYAKVFPGDAGRRIHEEGARLWQLSRSGDLGFDVAEPIAWDAGLRTLWQREVDGVSVVPDLAGPAGPALAERMGRAIATLPCTNLRPSALFDAGVQMQRSRRYAAELTERVPETARESSLLLHRLAHAHDVSPPRPLRAIHGAPHANQWLASGTRLALVDFDRLSLGDPELDVATFLGELDFEDGLDQPVEVLAAAFVTGYEAVYGPLRYPLLAAYRAHKRLAKALRSARALRANGDRRAVTHLARAHEALERETAP